MKHLNTGLFLCIITILTFFSIAHADGILRVPQEYGDDILFPLTGIHVDTEIHDQVAITTVRNSFEVEDDEDYIRASYHYRVPPNASVSGFAVWRDGEYSPYDLHAGEQGGPGGGAGDNEDLEEHLGSNPFTMPIDSIPNGIFMIEIRYVEFLSYDFGVIQMQYPLNCGGFIAGAIDTVSIRVQISAQRGIQDLEAVNFPDDTAIEFDGNFAASASCELEDYRPDCDWNLNVTYNQEDIGAWLYTHRSNLEEEGYFMLVIEPGIVDTSEQVTKYFTFVLDNSGSMRGSKIDQAKRAVLSCFNHLIDRDLFNIINFSYEIWQFEDEMVPANEANLRNARDYVNNIGANGGTNIFDALMLAVDQEMDENSANQIVFMTDGLPTAGETRDPDEIVQRVTQANEWNARIYSFGVGNDVNKAMLADLSDRNHGQSYLIDDGIDEIIEEFYMYISSPALINPVIEYDDDLKTDEVYPPDLENVSAGKQVLVTGRYLSFGEFDIDLVGQSIDGEERFEYESLEFPEEEEDNYFLPRMWAKSAIDYWLKYLDIHGHDQAIVDRIVELSIRYGILTPYTEYEEPPDAVGDPAFSYISYSVEDNGCTINWDFVNDERGICYNIYRAGSANGRFVKLNDEPLTATSFIDRGYCHGQTAFYRIEALLDDGSIWSETIIIGTMPDRFTVSEPVPNPFNSTASVNVQIATPGDLEISLYDLQGKLTKEIYRGYKEIGSYGFSIESSNLSAGTYLLSVQSAGKHEMKKLVLLR